MEMFPIVISLSAWADQLANKCTTFHAENQTLSEVMNKKSTKDKELLVLLCALVLFCLKHSILLKPSIFPDEQENENTKKKTKHDVALLHEFLVLKGEMRQMDELTPQQLNKFLSKFLITVRKKEDNEEYEPNSLRAFFASLERHLKKKNYGLCLMKDVQFEQTRKALQSKQRDLKWKGKGNKPNASAALTHYRPRVFWSLH